MIAVRLFSTREAAAYVGRSRQRIQQLVAAGRLRGQQTSAGWVFELVELDRLKRELVAERRGRRSLLRV